jgi:hypothetical protein
VLLRSGFWWRHHNAVAVPDLREKPRPKPEAPRQRQFAAAAEGAERYAQACIDGILVAPDGQGRKKAMRSRVCSTA